jgi:hypothetical protein
MKDEKIALSNFDSGKSVGRAFDRARPGDFFSPDIPVFQNLELDEIPVRLCLRGVLARLHLGDQ